MTLVLGISSNSLNDTLHENLAVQMLLFPSPPNPTPRHFTSPLSSILHCLLVFLRSDLGFLLRTAMHHRLSSRPVTRSQTLDLLVHCYAPRNVRSRLPPSYITGNTHILYRHLPVPLQRQQSRAYRTTSWNTSSRSTSPSLNELYFHSLNRLPSAYRVLTDPLQTALLS